MASKLSFGFGRRSFPRFSRYRRPRRRLGILKAALARAASHGDPDLFVVDVVGDASAVVALEGQTVVRAPTRIAEGKPPPQRPAPSLPTVSLPEGLHLDNLQSFLKEASVVRQEASKALRRNSSRYFCAEAPGSAERTDDGYLTKLGAKRSCVVCCEMGHQAWSCPFTRCHICFGVGHVTKNCPRAKEHCTHCGKRGHTAESCLFESLVVAGCHSSWVAGDGLRCARCGGRGHPLCVSAEAETVCAMRRPAAAHNAQEKASLLAKKVAAVVR